jgi:hypothetical protein
MDRLHPHRKPTQDAPKFDSSSAIYKAAEAHSKSYADVMRLASKDLAIPLVAQALYDHYGPRFTTFAHNNIFTIPSGEDGVQGIENHLRRFDKSGLGLDIEMAGLRVEAISSGAAACWITWRIHPRKAEVEPWSWTTVFGFRLPMGAEKGHWEYSISDQEIELVIQRVPDFMEL